MDYQSIINCLEALRDKMTPEQIAKLEALKAKEIKDKVKETESKRNITVVE
jgi:NH3-dependent NAD+ synthetase